MECVHLIRMLDHEHHVAPVADGVPVGRRRLRAHGRGSNSGQILRRIGIRRRFQIKDPDEVCDVPVGVFADDELPRKRTSERKSMSTLTSFFLFSQTGISKRDVITYS